MSQASPTRRQLLAAAASAGALLLVGGPRSSEAEKQAAAAEGDLFAPADPPNFPQLGLGAVSETVGASHFNFDRVKELVEARPELAVATWDWGFGDFEAAIDAASHVGRADIAEFLLRHGAKPTLFTFAMLGQVDVVRAALTADPALASNPGPHGIPLLAHAEAGRGRDGLSSEREAALDATIEYLKSMPGTDWPADIVELSAEEKSVYVGRYAFGPGEEQYASVSLNMRGLLSLGVGRPNGSPLEALEPGVFRFAGARSVRVKFAMEDGKPTGFSIFNPELLLRAKRTE